MSAVTRQHCHTKTCHEVTQKTLFGKIINLHNIADFDHETSFHSVLFQVYFKENDNDDDAALRAHPEL